MPHRIQRITITPVRVPIPVERVNCPEFPEKLNMLPDGSWGGTYFGDIEFYAMRVEGSDGAVPGWSDSTRGIDATLLAGYARAMIGVELPDDEREVVSAVEARLVAAFKSSPDSRRPIHYYKGLTTAALDWAGKVRSRPVHAFFGPRVQDRVRIEMWSGFRTPAAAARIAKKAAADGFKGLKLKAHLPLDVVGIAREVVAACGSDFSLNFDPNGRWLTYENVVERARQIVRVAPHVLLEDPAYDKPDVIARVRRETGIRTAITVTHPDQVRPLIDMHAIDAFNCIGLWSDISKSAAVARKHNIPVWLGSGVECGFSDMMAIHVGSTIANCTIGSDLVAHIVREDDLLKSPIARDARGAIVPDSPGLGIEADQDAIERYRTGDPIVVR